MKTERIEHAKLLCRECQIEKPTSEYHKCRSHPTGYQTYCKVCQNEKTAKYRKDTDCKYWKHKEGNPHYIYTITSPVGMVYVGYTSTTPNLRWQRHKAQFIHGKCTFLTLYYSFVTYGLDAHDFLVVGEAPTEEKARQDETQLILRLRNEGKALNDKISSIPVGQYDKKTGDLIKRWDSVIDAAKHYGKTSSWIYASMKHYRGNHTAFGYLWKVLPFQDGSIFDIKQKRIIEKAN